MTNNKLKLIEQAIREIIKLLENLLSYVLTSEGDEEDDA